MKDTNNPGSSAEPQSRVFIVREGVKFKGTVCGLRMGQRYWVLTEIKPVTTVSAIAPYMAIPRITRTLEDWEHVTSRAQAELQAARDLRQGNLRKVM